MERIEHTAGIGSGEKIFVFHLDITGKG